MAAPAFNTSVNSAPTGSTGTVVLPTTAANDILILVRVNGGATALSAPTGTYTGGTWTTIDSGTWTTGAGAVMWSRCTGNHVDETVTAAGTNSVCALIVRITGAITTGSPIDQASVTGATLGAVAGGALTGVATTALDTLVCYTGAIDDDTNASNATKGGVAMSNITSPTSSAGADSGVWYANSTQAAAGATGDFDLTNPAGTAQGKRVSSFAILSARHVVLSASSAVATPTLAVETPKVVPLGTAAAIATSTLAMTAPTTVVLGTSAAVSTPTLALTAKTTVALGTSVATSTASLSLTAKSLLSLASAGQSTATLAVATLGATTGVGIIELSPLDTPEAGTQTLSVRARASSGSGILRTTLYDSDGVTVRGTADFTLTGSFQTFTLNPSGITDHSALKVGLEGRSTTTLTVEVSWVEFRVPQSVAPAPADVVLQNAGAVSVPTLALTAPTQVPLGASSAQSTASATLTAKTTVVLGASAATATTSLAVTFVVPLGQSAGQSTATLSLKTTPQLALQADAVSSATIEVGRPIVIDLGAVHAVSTASTFPVGPAPAVETHPALGGIFSEAVTGGIVGFIRATGAYPGLVIPGSETIPGQSEVVFHTGFRSAAVDEMASSGVVSEHIASATAPSHRTGAQVSGQRGGVVTDGNRGGVIDEGLVGADEARTASGLVDESLRGAHLDERRRSADEERMTAGVVTESNRDGEVF